MGPSAIRYAGLDERLDGLGIEVERLRQRHRRDPRGRDRRERERARYLPDDPGRVLAARRSRDEDPATRASSRSCSVATTRSRWARSPACTRRMGPGGVLWVDAHGDLNRPETSPSGNVHGMPLAAALGACGFTVDGFDGSALGRPRSRGARRRPVLDPGEKDLIQELGIRVFTMPDIDRRGVADVMNEALEVDTGAGLRARLARRRRLRSRDRAGRRYAGEGRALVSRGSPRDGDRRRSRS